MAQATSHKREESHYRRMLKVAEAANAHLDLSHMLESLAAALRPVVPLDGIGVVTIAPDGMLKPPVIHIVERPRRAGETGAQPPERVFGIPLSGVEGAPTFRPIAGTTAEYVRDHRKPLVWTAANGSRAYTDLAAIRELGIDSFMCIPLSVHGWFVGAIYYVKNHPPVLDEDAARSLEEVTPAVALAVGNAMAFGEIRRLRDRLAQEVVALREAVDTQGMFEEIVGRSAPLREVLAIVSMVAPTDSTVLIQGETGTGKELIARAIHKRSPRAAGPLISVNCAALPGTLIASELFGHERGAFTGALQRRLGRFEMATDGTIFLDEIGDLPPDVQIALLRVLQERQFERVGGNQVVHTNARVITATNRDLRAAVEKGTFRSDLFFRLNVFPIEMPPLRSRPEDIPLLVEYFAQRHGRRAGKSFRSVDAASLRRLMAYPWPGNVRELENVIERAVILSQGERLRIGDRALRITRLPAGRDPSKQSASLRVNLREAEKALIEAALAACAGRVSGSNGAARQLDIPPTTLERKIRLHSIDKHRLHKN